MQSTERTLLRLHVEAVWGIQLPSFIQSDTLLPSLPLLSPATKHPSWKLCAAAITGDRVNIWRPDDQARERAALLTRENEALAMPPTAATPAITRDLALHQLASPTIDRTTLPQLARPLAS